MVLSGRSPSCHTNFSILFTSLLSSVQFSGTFTLVMWLNVHIGSFDSCLLSDTTFSTYPTIIHLSYDFWALLLFRSNRSANLRFLSNQIDSPTILLNIHFRVSSHYRQLFICFLFKSLIFLLTFLVMPSCSVSLVPLTLISCSLLILVYTFLICFYQSVCNLNSSVWLKCLYKIYYKNAI